MAEKILLIQPRWMTSNMTRQKVTMWREKYPRADFTLLSSSPIESNAIRNWSLPPFEAQKLAEFARQLRGVRFRRAIILTDAGHGDVGYGEAKFWAFVANARWRDFEGKPLTVWREATAKKKVALILTVRGIEAVCELLHVPQRVDLTGEAQQAWQDARTFVYLQHAIHQHGAEPGRVVFLNGNWSKTAACRCGWEIGDELSKATLVLITEEDRQTLNSINAKMICVAEVKNPLSDLKNRCQLENRAAFFNDEARDIWLVADS